ncbi:hypothetical protein V2G26_005400 [Clonostachys chloroleuca]
MDIINRFKVCIIKFYNIMEPRLRTMERQDAKRETHANTIVLLLQRSNEISPYERFNNLDFLRERASTKLLFPLPRVHYEQTKNQSRIRGIERALGPQPKARHTYIILLFLPRRNLTYVHHSSLSPRGGRANTTNTSASCLSLKRLCFRHIQSFT